MPIKDIAAMNAFLDNNYGPTRGPNAPDNLECALFNGDPQDDGIELDPTDNPGYAPAAVDQDTAWAGAAAGATTALVQFDDPTDAWADEATHWLLRDPDTGVGWDCAALLDPLDITDAGDGPQIAVTILYADALDPDA